MLEMNKMNDGMLKMVSGGDIGDMTKDCDQNQSRYQVGQYVEVYKLPAHVDITERKLIIDTRFKNGHWEYLCKYTDFFSMELKEWVTASDIQA